MKGWNHASSLPKALHFLGEMGWHCGGSNKSSTRSIESTTFRGVGWALKPLVVFSDPFLGWKQKQEIHRCLMSGGKMSWYHKCQENIAYFCVLQTWLLNVSKSSYLCNNFREATLKPKVTPIWNLHQILFSTLQCNMSLLNILRKPLRKSSNLSRDSIKFRAFLLMVKCYPDL